MLLVRPEERPSCSAFDAFVATLALVTLPLPDLAILAIPQLSPHGWAGGARLRGFRPAGGLWAWRRRVAEHRHHPMMSGTSDKAGRAYTLFFFVAGPAVNAYGRTHQDLNLRPLDPDSVAADARLLQQQPSVRSRAAARRANGTRPKTPPIRPHPPPSGDDRCVHSAYINARDPPSPKGERASDLLSYL